MRDALLRSATQRSNESDQHRDDFVAERLTFLDVVTRDEFQTSEQLQVRREFRGGAEGYLQAPRKLGGGAERVAFGDVGRNGKRCPAHLVGERKMTIERGSEGEVVCRVRQVLSPMPYFEVVELVHRTTVTAAARNRGTRTPRGGCHITHLSSPISHLSSLIPHLSSLVCV